MNRAKRAALPPLTGWFDLGQQKPWEPGVYEVRGDSFLLSDVRFSYWDGECFNWLSLDARAAWEMRAKLGGGYRVQRWRGLSADPAQPRMLGNSATVGLSRMGSLVGAFVLTGAGQHAALGLGDRLQPVICAAIERALQEAAHG